MARTSGGQSGNSPPPRLQVSLAQATAALDERLELGGELAKRRVDSETTYKSWSRDITTWDEYNKSWIERFIGPTISAEYARRGPRIYAATTWEQWARDQSDELSLYMRRLESVRARLELWVDDATEMAGRQEPNMKGPIFVVHGHDEAVLHTAVRLVEKTTDRKVIVLREQPNSGRALIEKFEELASSAAFAILLVTGDDIGGPKTAAMGDLRERARQNVVFELGFFFGKLGRVRVAVLLSEGVEKPSDIEGLVYNAIDTNGAWKTSLVKEFEAAGIGVDYSQIT
jgi:predicted nucleotide-binding protein